MGLITKIKSRRFKAGSSSETNTNNVQSKSTFFGMRRKHSPAPDPEGECSNDVKEVKLASMKQSLSLRVVSVPKEYNETNERFNWMTNELDSFEYKPSDEGDTVNAKKRSTEGHSPKSSLENSAPARTCREAGCFWLLPCWPVSPPLEKDAQTSPTTETSYDNGSGSTSKHENKEGQILEAKCVDDVSDVTSTPSEDCSDSESDEESEAEESRRSQIGLGEEDALSVSSTDS